MRPSFSYAHAVAWSLAITAVMIFGVIVVTALYPPFAESLLLVGLWEAIVYLCACGLLVRRVFGPARPSEVLALRGSAPSVFASAVLLGAVLHVPANSLAELAERVYPTPPEVVAERLARLTPASPLHAVVIFALVALLVPFVEEVFFRGALYAALERDTRRLGAAVVTTLCFTLAHVDPHLWIPLLVVAAALTHLRWASGSLWPCVALHASFNGLTLLAVFSGNAPKTPAPDMSLEVVLSGWILAAALWWLTHVLARRARAARTEVAP